jgi:DnaK suppressor protein
MTGRQLNTFKTTLEAQQAGIRPSIRQRDGIAIERTADVLDQMVFAAERELVTRNLERESKLFRNVRAALDRIEEGTYGTCVDCEEEIGIKRLNALPWTPLCIRCQELADNSRDEEGIFLKAA